jgi:hypothetical protein
MGNILIHALTGSLALIKVQTRMIQHQVQDIQSSGANRVLFVMSSARRMDWNVLKTNVLCMWRAIAVPGCALIKNHHKQLG